MSLTTRPEGLGQPTSLGRLVFDRRGKILALDRRIERLTGWTMMELVGEQAPELIGALPSIDKPTTARMRILGRDDTCHEVLARVVPLEATTPRFGIEVLQVLARESTRSREGARESLDPLTRLPDTHAFLLKLDEILLDADLHGFSVALIVVDVDRMTEINERYGRDVGDTVICKVGSILDAIIRGSDVVSRLDGDQFGVVLPRTGRGESSFAARRIRQTVESFQFARVEDNPVTTTVSLGVASYPADDLTSIGLLRAAQEALFEAGQLGLNRVWYAAGSPRVRLTTPVRCGGAKGPVLGMSRDLSNSGLFVETEDELDVGLRLGLSFSLPNDPKPVACVGRISRRVNSEDTLSMRPCGLGIELEQFDAGDRTRIEQFLMRSARSDGQVVRPGRIR